ncbi:GGDEF domain-containing protein [Saccharospirillum mangrovi]|uniref:GGDEF domain-containing protein n=1 Tax=Saccharospirillum mangrovi TaxID=2161747 RepID=UPI000D3AD8BC|nr:sensor domain-containing diguanylate cyclase [Saccharospirillum mangrovi]
MNDLSLLNRLADVVPEAERLDSLVPALLALLQSVTGLESTYLTRVDTEKGTQTILFSNNTDAQHLAIPQGSVGPWEDSLCKRAMDESRPISLNVSQQWGDSLAVSGLHIETFLSHAIWTGEGEFYGTLCAASPRSQPVSDEAQHILGLFSHLIGRQLDHDRLLVRLQRENLEFSHFALTDPLTGIPNRRAFDRELDRALAGAQRSDDQVHLGFIDLDGFKAINDEYGHDAGDRFLIAMAGQLKRGLRDGDFVARYGGDEFVVFGTAPAEIDPSRVRTQLVERLSRLTLGQFDLGSVSFDYPGASVGVVTAGDDERDIDALVARADAEMYQQKTARRKARQSR